MRATLRRITAVLSVSVTATAVLATPASATTVSANNWTCDSVSQFNAPPWNPAAGVGNCTGGDPQARGGNIISRRWPYPVSCGIIDATRAPQVVSGSFCSPP